LFHRETNIRKMLRPLTLHPSNPACSRSPLFGGDIAIGAYDGSLRGGVIRDWRFSTRAAQISANYYEIWKQLTGKPGRFYLYQAYLTLFEKLGPTNEKELIALQCDPQEYKIAPTIYKKGPHIHVSAAFAPIDKAHIALNLGHLDEVIVNVDNLMEALKRSIEMIRDEIVNRY